GAYVKYSTGGGFGFYPNVNISCIDVLPVACNRVEISGLMHPNVGVEFYNGVYDRSITSKNRPGYTRSDGYSLYYSLPAGMWFISDTLHSPNAHIFVQDSTLLPQDIHNTWQFLATRDVKENLTP
ncbi:unnamed protein product, partial [Owenia fusiformis]